MPRLQRACINDKCGCYCCCSWYQCSFNVVTTISDAGLLGIGARVFFIIFGSVSDLGTAFRMENLEKNFGLKNK